MSRFAVTLFVSATLLFACQPMVARMIVPLLGGAPAVWILCSLCFQALVLGGYFYAHVVGSRLRVRTQVMLQLALIASAFFVLPIVVDEALVQSLTAKSRSLGLLLVLLRSVGLPFFVLSTTSPLLQRWYAELGETDPYHLYAASNAGSMVALLGYPFAIEPFLALKEQSRLLTAAFAGYAVLVVVCALTALRKKHPPRMDATPAPAGVTVPEEITAAPGPESRARVTDEPSPASERVARPPQPLWRERLVWLLLAFAPSSLLLGATEFVTTDLASVPLLWVVPLALYLASFIVAFAKKQVVKPAIASRALALLAAIVAVSKVAEIHGPAWVIVGAHLLLLFVASVVCHRALAIRRPHHTRLTEFYLLLSVGGVLGGAFNGLVAPVVFDDLLEYPIAIALVLLGRLAIDKGEDLAALWRKDVAYGLGLAVVTFGLVKVGEIAAMNPRISVIWMYILPVLAAFVWSKRPVRYAVALGGILLVSTMHGGLTGNTIHKERDFFGVLKVRRDPSGRYLLLVSGSTLHGAQTLDPKSKRMPLTYYYPTGPVGDVLGPVPAASDPPRDAAVAARRVGVIGLGVGSLAAYARPGEAWTFFELNPRVVDIAKTYFSYLSDVPPGTSVAIEVGDARLRLREGGAGRFDLLVLDAFSSDAIPVHLMTREALIIYKRALAPGGVLLAHISNRHVLLEPILAALASDADLLAIGRDELDVEAGEREAEKASSHWVCLSDSLDALDAIAAKNKQWRRLPPPANQKVWTDDFANVLAAMHF
ncbi:MAG TPA: fused MFS/spermidine synthase [Labilithrix sp.]|nr:fused MFS/spermidine synthase [Labilithrix sp.]